MKLAAVTGANGMIGRRVIELLVRQGFSVRALLRQSRVDLEGVEVVAGDLSSDESLLQLTDGVDTIFHCAAELHDASVMQAVNVDATERLAQLAAEQGVACFIHISSAGVIGPTCEPWIDETTECHPDNAYETSKWQAEQALAALPDHRMRICMLRPINVIDNERPGLLSMAFRNSWQDRLALLIKGGESAHLVHAQDVAAAALHLAIAPAEAEGAFFVGCDEDERNTLAGVMRICGEVCGVGGGGSFYFPASVPYWLRRVTRGASLHGDSRFSSARLLATGFRLPLGLEAAIKKVCSEQVNRT